MKRLKHNFKKGMAFVLSLAMVAGLVPAMSGGANKVQAAPGSGTELSVSAYATKTQLMDRTFAPNADGTAVNYGKIVFGKKSDGTTAQEWYILGKDEGVSGDNTIIFAASPIETGQKFNSSRSSNKSFDSSFGVYASNPSEVYANHYGASDLRVALQGMATNTSYFTTAEQGLMNATTVKTEDTKNSNVTYTTTDKLYALQGKSSDSDKLRAGTSDSTVLAMSSYWSNGSRFWLRSPDVDFDDNALFAIPGNSVDYHYVSEEFAVQPASNLNLSSVLFASAATAASFDTVSGTLTDGTAMTVRLDGTGKNIGTVTYNATTADIKVVRGDASQPVSLIVQGNDGTKDWYYSKRIAGSETVNASDIKSALRLTSDIDLSACKIWLEITDRTENLTYAVNSDISSVAITGIDTPTANTTLDTSAACATTGVSSTTPQITWTPGDTTAGYNTSYTASITLTADTGYKFVDSTTATINGNTATSVNKNTDGTLTVTYAFPATAKDSITSVASVSAYATKTQLMDTTFAPNADGTAVNYGKIVFGKKSDGTTAQEWYILGKDEGVSGDNTIIFAASPIETGQKFNSSRSSNKSFDSSFGVYASNPSEVYANHYGASDLRVALQGMATNTSYFTTAEQGLMNATTVKTEDTKNSNVTYTTTDKLYALQGKSSDSDKLRAGTSDSTVLAMSSYWSNGSGFWLRSPNSTSYRYAFFAEPRIYVLSERINGGWDVRPASNLNLSSVLFASAATAASRFTVEAGTIALDKAMTLRLDGTGKNIGTVTYNATAGDIKVDTSQPVSLVVQGNDGTRDWYYSKQITGPDTVNASDIKSELVSQPYIDLSACKIWLEITDSTDNLTYAVNATETVDSDISSVAITGIDTPTANTTLDTSAACATTGVSSTTPQITWTPGDTTAGYNTSYTASITLTADTGYKFVDSTTATINGNTATSVNKNTDGTLTVTYAFPATAKDKLTSVTAPQAITVANGTAYSAMNLPDQVNIVTEGNTESSAQVTWDTTTPASGSYDPAVLTQQTVTLNGTVDCPDSIDANGVSLTTTITITISAAGIVKTPVKLTVDNVTKHIGKADPEFTYKVEGLVEGDTLNGIELKRAEGETPGDYEITASVNVGSNPNYNIVEIKNGKLTIEDHDWSEWITDGNHEKATCNKCDQIKYRAIDSSDTGSIEKDAEITSDSPIKKAILDNTKSQLVDADNIFTADEKRKIEGGADARVWLEISAAEEIKEEDKRGIENRARDIMGSDISKVVYFDVKLYKSISNGSAITQSQITKPGIDIEVSVTLPENLLQSDSTITRAYKIIRLHEGVVDSFDADFDSVSGMLKFKTDRFSTYAIAFTDTQHASSASISSPAGKNTLISVGDTLQLTATVLPENTADKSVTWTSSDSTVATVDETGKVTAVANGTATITATTANGVKAAFTITVNISAQPDTPTEPGNPSTPGNQEPAKAPAVSENSSTVQPETTADTSEDSTESSKEEKSKGPDAPKRSKLKVNAPTVKGGSNGTVSGVNSKMEYSTDGGKTWKPVKGKKITRLKAGQVRIRIKETAKRKAGKIVVVTIPEGKYPNKEQIRRNSVRLISKASAQWTKNKSLKLRWGKVKDADGYEVYLRKCDGINIYTKVEYDITNNKQTSLLVKKLDGEKFISTFNYKYAVRAYKKIDGKKVYIGKTLTYHFIGSGNKWNTNPKKVTVKNAKMTLGVKKSVTLKAVVTKVDDTLALTDHESEIRYVSSNPKIAKVDMKTGKVTGLKKGKCTIYCIAINGVSTRVEVTIK